MNFLILSYYFKPLNSITVNRVEAYIKGLTDKNHNVYLITRYYKKNSMTWDEICSIESEKKQITVEVVNKQFKIIRVPQQIKKNKNSYLLSIRNLINNEFGVYTSTSNFVDGLDFIEEKIDYILVSIPPVNLLKTALQINTKLNAKLLLDIRDFQNHIILNKNNNINFKSKIEHFFIKRFYKKEIHNFDQIFAVNKQFLDFFSSYPIEKKELILNGFEKSIFDKYVDKEIDTNCFQISVLGTIYPKQNILLFCDIINEFVKNKQNVKINFIGLLAIPQMKDKILNNIDELNICYFTNRISREECLEIGAKSSILFYPAWEDYKGVYSGKIFDYVGLRRSILIAPTDNDVIHEIVMNNKLGIATSSVNEGLCFLNKKYIDWKNNKINKNICLDEYSREIQINKMFKKIT
ncbi:glycosyltransferase family 4 protein [Flammeovirga kamogawensis]|uniref:Glycosyltransferase family 4 protein n=1 Tax=Flammeovirga kamogawensis TaxID=373891 RepID=A0ABX8GXH1_9BACT|nr:glycosyltransferase family 4 protein [Flammeovirga kamogawensis]MBB6460750.1 glycosyltransferase involved in cell wall biosynthesis [Flammeovirga kamogawensis]QWG08103.1 hypothetical protein KM029_03965 [Flammeovirga kamogawensis]TRX69906.1 glycosyltransferase family 4 protein [Flammeovirga kamogawensis]